MLPWLLGAAAVAVAAAILSDDDKKSSNQDDTEDEDEAPRRAAQQRKRAAQQNLSEDVNNYCIQKKEALVEALEPYFICELEPITIDLNKEIQTKISDISSANFIDMNIFHFNGLDKHEAIETVVNNIAYMQTRYEAFVHPTFDLKDCLADITRLDNQLKQLAILDEKVNELLTQIEE